MSHSGIRRFLVRFALFSVPFLVYGAVVVLVDPFEFFGVSSVFPRDLKVRTAARINSTMWALPEYLRHPTPGLLLGDSRMAAMDADSVSARTGIGFTNLAYGGGTLREAIDTFHLVEEKGALRRVYLGINFNLYSDANSRNRVRDVRAELKNPLLYFTDVNVIDALWRLIKSRFSGHVAAVGRPEDRERFWKRQIDVTTRLFYGEYRYPKEFKKELHAMADDCRKRGIALALVIFPSHMDLQDQVGVYHLEPEYARFKEDLRDVAPVYDFDWPNAFTENRENFKDPYHVSDAAESEVMDGVWGAGSPWVKRYPGPGGVAGE